MGLAEWRVGDRPRDLDERDPAHAFHRFASWRVLHCTFFTFASGTIWSDILVAADNALYCTTSVRVFECRI